MKVVFGAAGVVLAALLAGCASVDFAVAGANAGQSAAEKLGTAEFDRQQAAFQKAEAKYLQGRDKELKKLEKAHPGFTAEVLSGDEVRAAAAVELLSERDVAAAYWAGAGWLGAFSLNPLDDTLLAGIRGAPVLLEKAAALEPLFHGGAIFDVLLAWYASAPPEFGGNEERARECFDAEVALTGGASPIPFVTWAASWCRQRQDAAGFTAALETALALKPRKGAGTSMVTRSMEKSALQKARWLLDTKADYFLDWGDE
jgi:predicted anti-sigma-YlaC factor YlaD